MRTLGLNISGYISSAALVESGRIISAACEERFSRSKRDRSFPAQTIRWCLAQSRLSLDDVDRVAVAWNPSRNLSRSLGMLKEANRSRGLYLSYVPNELASQFGLVPEAQAAQQLLGRDIVYVDHHLAHAASACYSSPWEHGAVATVDAFGEEDAITLGRFQGGDIQVLQRVAFPHSMGSFYSYFTEFLGFQADADEYKVMALGAFADRDEAERLLDAVKSTYRMGSVEGRLDFQLDLSLFDFYLFHRPHDFTALARRLGFGPRHKDDPLEGRHYALAWALQQSFEDQMFTVMRHLKTLTGESHVAVAGGCFMNSVANGRLALARDLFESVHVPPYPDDSGTAMGAALLASGRALDEPRAASRHNFFGPTLTASLAAAALDRRKLGFEKLANKPEAIARRLEQGEILGYGYGAMEFGQRALGHRSIFADPRIPDIRDQINFHVKGREWFRPYAASILADQVSTVFDVPENFEALFMEKVAQVRPEWAEKIPGILHADGSVRLHTVDPETQPDLHAILRAFHDLTGVPLVLNTSFNVAGMPIVCTAEDAIGCFFACGLDSLVLDDLLVTKPRSGRKGPGEPT